MKPRERFLALLERRPVDRLPVDFWQTEEVSAMLRAHCGVEDDLAMYRALGVDKAVTIHLPYTGYLAGEEGPHVPMGTHFGGRRSMWGAEFIRKQSGAATYLEARTHPLADAGTVADVEACLYWPDPDLFDYEAAAAECRRTAEEFITLTPWISLYEVYCQMRGLEKALMDLFMAPDLLRAALDRIEAIQAESLRRYFTAAEGAVDLCFISDDMASQNGLFMPLETWDEHFRPRMERWCELIHSFGVKVFYHSDGAVEPLIPRLIDVGVDILNPIQHVCPGMAPAGLKEKYGDRIIFHGGVDNQKVLPFGSPDEVREETRMLLRTLGAGREGYVCASCHAIQPNTPVENILAFIETAIAEGADL